MLNIASQAEEEGLLGVDPQYKAAQKKAYAETWEAIAHSSTR